MLRIRHLEQNMRTTYFLQKTIITSNYEQIIQIIKVKRRIIGTMC